MSRILIVNNNMHIGGVQKALVNLLRKISAANDVTLLLLHKGGELLNQIPDTVTVIEPCRSLRCWGMSKFDVDDKGQLLERSFWAALTRLFGRGLSFRWAVRSQQRLTGYDVAISYLHSGNPKAFYGGCAEFVLQSVDAKKKICFLHNDFRQINALSEYNSRLYASFDVIAACSEGCRRAFLEVMPALAGKVHVVPNCIGYDEVKRMAAEKSVAVDRFCVNIVTVARLGREKGVVRAIKALSSLIGQGHRFHYYVVGDGVERQAIQRAIEEMELGNSITLVGEQVNPYPLVSACDLLLVPSYAEAAPLVIDEAACLGVPVLSTKTSSSSEMIEKTGIGWVCENTD
jgi:glycosyltransferase involved in cell wall biosynthesis